MRNSKGFITLDFLFSVVLILGLTMLLFRVCISLTTASITQYITFAAARNYVAAHQQPADQVRMAELKYAELVGNAVFKPLYTNGWFEIQDKPDVGNIAEVKTEFNPEMKNKFFGGGTSFVAKVLDFKIALFGSSDPEGDGSGSGFQTYVGSFMGREPTANECWQFTQERWRAIRNLSPSTGASYSTGTSSGAYKPIEDSGC